MSSISLTKCNYEPYKFDETMYLVEYTFEDGSKETDECPTPVDVYLNLETAFFGGNADEEQQGWLLEMQAWCENAEVGDTYTDDDDFSITKVK